MMTKVKNGWFAQQEPETPVPPPIAPDPMPTQPDPYPISDPLPEPNDPTGPTFPTPPEPIPQYPPDVTF